MSWTGTIKVCVENTAGNGISNASVSGREGSCTTSSNGCCSCTVRVGTNHVRASHAGYITREQRVYVSSGDHVNVYFTVGNGMALSASIEGTVYDSEGMIRPNFMVWGAGTLGNRNMWGTTTNSSGQYSLPIISAGDYIIYCGKNNFEIVGTINYSQTSVYPTSTTIIDFSGNNAAKRISDSFPRLGVYNRTVVINDDIGRYSFFTPDEPSTPNVFAKVRKWKSSMNTYYNHNDRQILDGYGGANYE
jgi:hypothetical protein